MRSSLRRSPATDWRSAITSRRFRFATTCWVSATWTLTVWATPVISVARSRIWTTLEETWVATRAESAALRPISPLAADCSSTAVAVAAAASSICSITPITARMEATLSPTAARRPLIWAAISPVALAVWPARFFTSVATTAKPLPASPARAASMVAFSASRLVCPAMDAMREATWLISAVAVSMRSMAPAASRASATARRATSLDRPACRAISDPDAPSSSVAAATLAALALACSAAEETTSVLSRTAVSASIRSAIPALTPWLLRSTSTQVMSRSSSMDLQVSNSARRTYSFCFSSFSRASMTP